VSGADRPASRVRALLALLAAALLLCACGLGAQSDPEPVDLTAGAGGGAGVLPSPGGMQLPVYFIAGERLRVTHRRVGSASLQVVLDQLAAGPTSAEAGGGVRTAVLPQVLVAGPAPAGLRGTASVVVGPELRNASGTEQILAIAQVVYTVTELPDVDAVVMTTPEGEVVEAPTDRGLSREPVTRADYRSVAPVPEPPPAPAQQTPVQPAPAQPAPVQPAPATASAS